VIRREGEKESLSMWNLQWQKRDLDKRKNLRKQAVQFHRK
jgi:hypothetical protein